MLNFEKPLPLWLKYVLSVVALVFSAEGLGIINLLHQATYMKIVGIAPLVWLALEVIFGARRSEINRVFQKEEEKKKGGDPPILLLVLASLIAASLLSGCRKTRQATPVEISHNLDADRDALKAKLRADHEADENMDALVDALPDDSLRGLLANDPEFNAELQRYRQSP